MKKALIVDKKLDIEQRFLILKIKKTLRKQDHLLLLNGLFRELDGRYLSNVRGLKAISGL
jgi:hypothetical protein